MKGSGLTGKVLRRRPSQQGVPRQTAQDDSGSIRFVCLANSRMHGGRCVAGKEVDNSGRPGPWIRLVSIESDGVLSSDEIRIWAHGEILVGDILEVPLSRSESVTVGDTRYQTENRFVFPSSWTRKGRMTREDLSRFVDPDSRWWVGAGVSDRTIEVEYANEHVRHSLHMFEVARAKVYVDGERKVRVNFWYRGESHYLSVTDVSVERYYKNKGPGMYEADTSGEHPLLFVVSLGKPFQGRAWKLVATAIGLDGRP